MKPIFSNEERQLLDRPNPIQILKVKPGESRIVQLGDSPMSRRLVPLHYDVAKGRSASCSGPGICKRCIAGEKVRVFLYLAARTTNGVPVIVCVSKDVANQWMTKSPDFQHQFAVERPKNSNAGTTLREITTHGRFAEPWEGFLIAPELERLFGWEKRHGSI